MSFPTGASTVIRIKKQTVDRETASVGNFISVPVTALSITPEQNLLENDLLGLGRNAQRPERAQTNIPGSVTVPVDLRYFGHWLNMLLGAPVTTGTGPYTHVWSSGGAVPTFYSIEQGHPDAASPAYLMSVGVMATGMRLNFASGQTATASFDLSTYQQTSSGVSGAGTPTTLAFDRFSQNQSFIKKDGTALGRVLSFAPAFSNSVEEDRYVGDGDKIGDIGLGVATFTGDMTVRFRDLTLHNIGVNGTVFDFNVGFLKSVSESLTIDCDQVELSRAGVPITGTGGIEQRFRTIASYSDSTQKMMTATLVNDVAAY